MQVISNLKNGQKRYNLCCLPRSGWWTLTGEYDQLELYFSHIMFVLWIKHFSPQAYKHCIVLYLHCLFGFLLSRLLTYRLFYKSFAVKILLYSCLCTIFSIGCFFAYSRYRFVCCLLYIWLVLWILAARWLWFID